MEERRNEILKELDRKGRVKVTDLSKEFGCSEVTIRNDGFSVQSATFSAR